MRIKNKLSLYFTILSAVLSLLVLIAVNILFGQHTDDDFFTALKERAIVTAQVYLEADEISDSSLQHFRGEYLNTLPSEITRMYDSNANPVFIKDNNLNWPKSIINHVLNHKYLQYKDEKSGVVGIRYDDNQGSFVILASAIDKAGTERKQNLLRITIALYILQLIMLFFASRWFASKMLHPVQKINSQVQIINATDLHLRLDKGNGKDEISELAMNFNALLQRLETSFDLQKTFVANVSHELRTPLTTIIGEIEVAISFPREKEEYSRILHSALIEAEKLNDVIDGLLRLSSIEKIVTLQAVEKVRIDDVLWEMQAFCLKSEPINILQINLISLPEDENKLCITASKDLLNIAFGNIIRNAFKFSYNQPVQCTLSYTHKGIEIKIKDKGIGINEEDLKNIFQPFYRSSEVAGFNGQGIGLFITKKIIDLYKGTILFESEIGKGTTVNIIFS
jgi:signal transduction histidine kinase